MIDLGCEWIDRDVEPAQRPKQKILLYRWITKTFA